MDAFIGMIIAAIFPSSRGDPVNWMLCDGRTLPVSQYQALFSLIGNTYGGDGRTTFKLPNLKGTFPLGASAAFPLGQTGGSASVALTIANLPAHSHTYNASDQGPTVDVPGNNFVPTFPDNPKVSYYAATAQTLQPMNPAVIGTTGSNAPVPTMPPYATVNYYICYNGIYPMFQ